MRVIFCLLVFTISLKSFAGLGYCFDKDEAKDMIAICNSFYFIELYNSDTAILPSGYEKIYSSGTFGMENKYQIYKKGDIAVISFRGSISKKLSWLENINSAMIPAQGTIKISGDDFKYQFAQDTAAAVHSGYALALAYLSKDVLYHINILNNQGIYNIIITGHSQGGALANILRAYLENLSNFEISKNNRFKTYAFAAPMVGNVDFVAEYNVRYCRNESSFNIINPEDVIPNMPFSYDEGEYAKGILAKLIFDPDSVDTKKLMTDFVFNTFKGTMNRSLKRMSSNISNQISKDLGSIEMPAYDEDANYYKIGNRIEISPAIYPQIIIDSSPINEDQNKEGKENKPTGQSYKKEPGNFQHLPYNYYVSFLKTFFSDQYYLLEKKYLPETL
jgi:triacylglycerol lipase